MISTILKRLSARVFVAQNSSYVNCGSSTAGVHSAWLQCCSRKLFLFMTEYRQTFERQVLVPKLVYTCVVCLDPEVESSQSVCSRFHC